MEEQKKYFYSADIIRAIAIILVVIIHISSELVNTPRIFLTPDWWFANFIDSLARVAVPLFIMLSGFLILHPGKSYSAITFLKKRLGKIGLIS